MKKGKKKEKIVVEYFKPINNWSMTKYRRLIFVFSPELWNRFRDNPLDIRAPNRSKDCVGVFSSWRCSLQIQPQASQVEDIVHLSSSSDALPLKRSTVSAYLSNTPNLTKSRWQRRDFSVFALASCPPSKIPCN